ncbi:periplasmic binding protein-like I [Globomyces pollinis-pini]|nr:periplasmic binding protein-like I [Globomyces pollinis-pini]
MRYKIVSLLSCLCSALTPNGSNRIKIGISIGYVPDDMILLEGVEAVYLRIKQLNENSDLLGDDTTLEPVLLNNELARDLNIVNALEFQKEGVVAVIGSGWSSLSILTSLVLQNYNIPQCCGSSTNPSLSDKNQYPNFFRVIPTDASQAAAMMGYVVASGWKKIAIIHTNEDYGGGLANFLSTLARENSVEILAKVNIEMETTEHQADAAVHILRESGARIIFYCGYVNEFMVVLKYARSMGIFGKDYVWMGPDALIDLPTMFPDDSDLYNGMLSFYPTEKQGPEAEPFAEYWRNNRLQTTFINASLSSVEPPKSYIYFYATCVDLFLNGFDALLKSNPDWTVNDLATGKLNEYMKVPESFTFPDIATPSGYVRADENGDRSGDFSVYNYLSNQKVQIVGGWNNGKKVLDPNFPIVYPGGSTVQPKDGIDPNDVAVYAELSGGAGILSIICAALGFALTLLSYVGIIIYKKSGVIKKSSYLIGYGMQLAILLVNFQFLVMIDKPSQLKCTIDSIVIPITFSLYYGLLFAKTLRIYRIFFLPRAALKLTDFKLYLTALLITLPSIIICVIWNVFDAPRPYIKQISQTQFYWTCASGSLGGTAMNLLILVNSLVLIGNLILAVMTRNVLSTYNETKMIGLSVYNTTIIGLFSLAILVSDSLGFTAKYIIKNLAVFYILIFNLGTSFLLKIYQAITTTDSSTNNSKASNNSSVINAEKTKIKKITKDQRCEVTIKTLGGLAGIFAEAQPVALHQNSPECVLIASIKRLSLESSSTSECGYGIFWNLPHIKTFSIVGKGPMTRQFTVDDKVYECRFQTEEDCVSWTKFFENWTYRMKSNVSNPQSMTRQH